MIGPATFLHEAVFALPVNPNLIDSASRAVTTGAMTRSKTSPKERNGSPGLIRTGGRPINSRMLYR